MKSRYSNLDFDQTNWPVRSKNAFSSNVCVFNIYFVLHSLAVTLLFILYTFVEVSHIYFFHSRAPNILYIVEMTEKINLTGSIIHNENKHQKSTVEKIQCINKKVLQK
jgi:hypothetical protein